ncbi:MAG: PepSY-associated TM helix domain-containing protein, partial [Pseudomonadota bacterium]
HRLLSVPGLLRMTRKFWFSLHSWCGLNLSVLMSFVLVTGTLATVSAEIDWLASPDFRADLSNQGDIDWGKSYEHARTYAPNAQLLNINAPIDSWFATTAIAIDENGERFRIFLDPATSKVNGSGRWNNWQRFFRQTHRHLMLPIKVGVTIVGLLAIPLLIAAYSGTVIYKRWWRGFLVNPLARIEVRNDGQDSVNSRRRYWGNVHRWVGVWSLWFVLLMALTGLWYLLEQWGLQHRYSAPEIADLPITAGTESLSGNDINQYVERAVAARPDFSITSIALPSENRPLIQIRGQLDAVLVRPRANQLTFDVRSRGLIESRDGTLPWYRYMLVPLPEEKNPPTIRPGYGPDM